MSKIALTPNASGTGIFTIASPNSDTDRVLTLPDEAGTVLTSATTGQFFDPVRFHARKTTDQNGNSDETDIDVGFDFEVIDSASAFASDRFTVPSGQGGAYFLYAQVLVEGGTANVRDVYLGIMKSSDSGSTFSTLLVGGARYASNDVQGPMNHAHGIVTLSAGDIVKVRMYANTVDNGTFNIKSSITDLGFGEGDMDFAGFHGMTAFGGYRIA